MPKSPINNPSSSYQENFRTALSLKMPIIIILSKIDEADDDMIIEAISNIELIINEYGK